eukprot:gene4703-5975_t
MTSQEGHQYWINTSGLGLTHDPDVVAATLASTTALSAVVCEQKRDSPISAARRSNLRSGAGTSPALLLPPIPASPVADMTQVTNEFIRQRSAEASLRRQRSWQYSAARRDVEFLLRRHSGALSRARRYLDLWEPLVREQAAD